MNLNILEDHIKTNNIDDAVKIISDIGDMKLVEAVPILIKYLQDTENGRLRNIIAIALSDIGCVDAVEPIINMIRNPKTIGNRGTLLYSLESFDYSSHIEMIVELLFDDNFEVSRHALILVESILNRISDESKQKVVKRLKSELGILQEKIDFLMEAVEMFLAE